MSEILDFTKEQKTVFVEATMSVSMSKSICLEMPENYTNAELIAAAEREIKSPNEIIKVLKNLLVQYTGILVKDGDDWNVDDITIVEG